MSDITNLLANLATVADSLKSIAESLKSIDASVAHRNTVLTQLVPVATPVKGAEAPAAEKPVSKSLPKAEAPAAKKVEKPAAKKTPEPEPEVDADEDLDLGESETEVSETFTKEQARAFISGYMPAHTPILKASLTACKLANFKDLTDDKATAFVTEVKKRLKEAGVL